MTKMVKMTLKGAFEAIRVEHAKATDKYPPFNSSHEAFAVLLEEVDELWDEVKADRPWHAMNEAIQVAAMAIRFLTEIAGPETPAANDLPDDLEGA